MLHGRGGFYGGLCMLCYCFSLRCFPESRCLPIYSHPFPSHQDTVQVISPTSSCHTSLQTHIFIPSEQLQNHVIPSSLYYADNSPTPFNFRDKTLNSAKFVVCTTTMLNGHQVSKHGEVNTNLTECSSRIR